MLKLLEKLAYLRGMIKVSLLKKYNILCCFTAYLRKERKGRVKLDFSHFTVTGLNRENILLEWMQFINYQISLKLIDLIHQLIII